MSIDRESGLTPDIVSELTKLGLTPLESKIYVHKLWRGQVKACEVSKGFDATGSGLASE